MKHKKQKKHKKERKEKKQNKIKTYVINGKDPSNITKLLKGNDIGTSIC